jgi:hypothetical protein
MAELRLHVAGYADSDDEERADLAWRLKRELREGTVPALVMALEGTASSTT